MADLFANYKLMKCKNCGANPAEQSDCVLHRINPLGVIGEWICQDCLGEMETLDGVPHYVHSKDCPGYCDYACNGESGFEMAEQIKNYIRFPHDGSKPLLVVKG